MEKLLKHYQNKQGHQPGVLLGSGPMHKDHLLLIRLVFIVQDSQNLMKWVSNM